MSAVCLGGWNSNRLWLAGLRVARLDCLERRHCESSRVFSELPIAQATPPKFRLVMSDTLARRIGRRPDP